MSYRVLVLTSDKYLHALKSFVYLFEKYWSKTQQVLVGGFSVPPFPMPSNFKFHSIGRMDEYPIQRWSDALIKFLSEVEDDAFVLMLEDYWLTRPVNLDAVDKCIGYARQFQYVLRIDLTTDRMFSSGPHYPNEIEDYATLGYLDLIRSEPGTPYHMSLMAAVGRRDRLLEILVPGETPWELEIAGSTRASDRGNNVLVLGTRQWPVRHILGYRGGNSGEMHTEGLQLADIQALRQFA